MSQSTELTKQTDGKSLAQRFTNPVVAGMAMLLANAGLQVPQVAYGSATAALLFGGISLFRERRAQAYLDELEQKLGEVADEKLNSEEFVHLFQETARYALNTQQEEKARLFACILANFAQIESAVDVAPYEEAAAILNDLSSREFQVLTILHGYEKEDSRISREVHQLFWLRFLEEVEVALVVPLSEIPGILTRLERTGLYQSWADTEDADTEWRGLRFDFPVGHLTSNFDIFIQFLQTRIEQEGKPSSYPTNGAAPTVPASDDRQYALSLFRKPPPLPEAPVFFRISSKLSEAEAREFIDRISSASEAQFTFIGSKKLGPHVHFGSPTDYFRYTAQPSLAMNADQVREYLRRFPEEIDLITRDSAKLHL